MMSLDTYKEGSIDCLDYLAPNRFITLNDIE